MNYRYNYISEYLKEKFGERTLKICLDGNFTCPNRDGTKGIGGCIYCSERGSGEHLSKKSIKEQLDDYFKSYKSNRANKFIVYFQNFTNTYDTIENLNNKYTSSLSYSDKIVGIDIATRPDSINEDICKLLQSINEKYYVSVELGLQTSNEEIGKYINRCYTNMDFINAVKLLNKYNIDICAHIMCGLPNETFDDIKNTIDFINSLSIKMIKIHNTYVVKNTKLEELYLNKEYNPIDLESYLDYLEYIITHLRNDIIISRLCGDSPKDILVAPEWNIHKKWVLNGINKRLKEKDLYQGIYFNK